MNHTSLWCFESGKAEAHLTDRSNRKNKGYISDSTHLPPTESSNRDLQHLTITILHTKKVSDAGSGGEREQTLPQHHKSALPLYISSCCLGNQLQAPPASGPIANCHPSQSGTHTPDRSQSIITGLIKNTLSRSKHNKSTRTVVTAMDWVIKWEQPTHTTSHKYTRGKRMV